jgi:thymidylate synthase
MKFEEGDQFCRAAIAAVIRDGQRAAPRGKAVLELTEPIVLTLTDPTRPFLMSPARRANYRYGMAEACWIASGSDSLSTIAKYNSRMKEFSDDGERLWGAYGPRLIEQLQHVVSILQRDPDSRQAVLTTWRPMVPATLRPLSPSWDGASWRSKDVPCTVAWHFMIRNGKLNLSVFMRSNDAWLGTPYDILSFTTVQRAVASILCIEVGAYNHVVSNLHLYEENVADAQRLLLSEPVASVALPGFNFASISDMTLAFASALAGGIAWSSNPGVDAYAAVIHKRPGAIGVPVR